LLSTFLSVFKVGEYWEEGVTITRERLRDWPGGSTIKSLFCIR